MAKRKPARAADPKVSYDPRDLPEDYRELFSGSGKWFRHTDIPGKDLDDEMVVTIEDVTRGLVGKRGGDKKPQYLLKLEGEAKTLGANPTNCDTIARMYGRNPRLWVGKSIVIYRDEITMHDTGELKRCIRVRPYLPPGARPMKKRPAKKAIKIKRRAA